MRTFTLAASLALLLANSAMAQTVLRFQGEFLILNSNGFCSGDDPTGSSGNIRLRILPYGGGSAMALYQRASVQAFRLQDGLFNNSYKNVETMTVNNARFRASPHPVSVKITRQVPADIAATKFVSISGNIFGYGADPDCEVSFRAALVMKAS